MLGVAVTAAEAGDAVHISAAAAASAAMEIRLLVADAFRSSVKFARRPSAMPKELSMSFPP